MCIMDVVSQKYEQRTAVTTALFKKQKYDANIMSFISGF